MLLFARDSGLTGGAAGAELEKTLAAFGQSGALPPLPELSRWKGLVRRNEAVAAARICGVALNRLHFLDLPFYHAAAGRRRELAKVDVDRMKALLEQVQPHLIYAAGDLDDPHGTHRLCLKALSEALAQSASTAWYAAAELWLYRGAWAEWEADEIDLAVPLSPQEVLRRRRAIFRHETQKDQAIFLGSERREFWQRTEDRSRLLAERYNALGLAEYEAIEAFKRFTPDELVRQMSS